MVPALIPEREREHSQHDKQHAHPVILAVAGQALITKVATVLTTGTSIPAARFIAERGGANPTVGTSICGRWQSPQSRMEVPMPYLFWAVVPFELMKMWWDACERARETSSGK